MGGHGGLNILPQKRWNVYNYENREKVRRDEEAATREEQLKRKQQRKRDAELRLEHLRTARGLAPLTKPPEPDQKTEPEPEKKSNHINLFEGIKIFDPVEVEAPKKAKKVEKEEARVVTAEDEKYRLGYGVAGKGTKVPWYLEKKSAEVDDERVENEDDRRVKEGKRKRSGKKSLEELREERLRRENKEKERQLLREMSRIDGGFSRREVQVVVMTASMGCARCRQRVSQVTSKMKGLREYTVDMLSKQVTVKGDFHYKLKEEDGYFNCEMNNG